MKVWWEGVDGKRVPRRKRVKMFGPKGLGVRRVTKNVCVDMYIGVCVKGRNFSLFLKKSTRVYCKVMVL